MLNKEARWQIKEAFSEVEHLLEMTKEHTRLEQLEEAGGYAIHLTEEVHKLQKLLIGYSRPQGRPS